LSRAFNEAPNSCSSHRGKQRNCRTGFRAERLHDAVRDRHRAPEANRRGVQRAGRRGSSRCGASRAVAALTRWTPRFASVRGDDRGRRRAGARAEAGSAVPLLPAVDEQEVRRFVKLSTNASPFLPPMRRLSRLKGLRPQFTKEKPGVKVLRELTVRRIVHALQSPRLRSHPRRLGRRSCRRGRSSTSRGGRHSARRQRAALLQRRAVAAEFGSRPVSRSIRRRPGRSASSTCS